LNPKISARNTTNNDRPEKTPGSFRGALRIALVYFVIGSLWIFVSDAAITLLGLKPEETQTVSIIKGILYVVVTALVIFELVRRALKGEAVYAGKLDESYARLQEHCEALDESRRSHMESEEQYRLLFTALLSGYCVHELVRDGGGAPVGIRALNTNPAFAGIAGLAAGDGLEEAFLRLLPGERRGWLERFAEVVETGKAMHFQTGNPGRELEFTVFRPAPERFAAIINDVSDRKRMEKALNEESQQLKVTLDSIGDGVVAVDAEGRISMFNGVAGQLFGLNSPDALGMKAGDAFERFGGASGTKFAAKMANALERGDTGAVRGDIRLRYEDGTERLLSGSATPMRNGRETLGFVAVFRDVTEQQQKEAEILYLNYHDLLTGLYNRNFFEEELKRLDTERQLPLSVIMGDANNLKLVNDVFGHREGDELLRAMARLLKESCRSEDIISRWGGDEFTILLPRTDADRAALICRRIQAKCKDFRTAERRVRPSISLGHETKTDMAVDIAHVIKSAEDMMYKNKLLDSRTAHNDFLEMMRGRVGEDDMETERHINRLTELCVRTGRELNLRENDLADLRILALLHDIGKAAIDPDILNKPSTLTGDEWEEIKRHSGLGYRIVRSAPELMLVADYILGHHERWDGGGYPQGLKGEQIPLASRIFAVADAFDVMTQGRPYRTAISPETALMEIFRNAGTQFDPDVVIAFAPVLHSLDEEMK
jgi:diguanylate cyclase (GGDEF)-like protein/PAS domain S-box-containing protein